MKIRNFFLILFLAIVGIGLFNLYYIPSPTSVKPKIQNFIDTKYGKKFKVIQVTKDYNPDLFHEPWGYSIILEDTSGIRFGNVLVEDNKVQGWITFGGTDIEAEYQK